MLLSLSVEVYTSPTAAVTENKGIANVKNALSKLTLKRKSRKSKEKKKAGKEGEHPYCYNKYIDTILLQCFLPLQILKLNIV